MLPPALFRKKPLGLNFRLSEGIRKDLGSSLISLTFLYFFFFGSPAMNCDGSSEPCHISTKAKSKIRNEECTLEDEIVLILKRQNAAVKCDKPPPKKKPLDPRLLLTSEGQFFFQHFSSCCFGPAPLFLIIIIFL